VEGKEEPLPTVAELDEEVKGSNEFLKYLTKLKADLAAGQ
jgi:hypothetical protein